MRILSPFVLLLWIMNWTFVASYNILMILPVSSKSHKNAFDPIAEVLAQKGHQITIMSPFKETTQVKGVHNVHLKNVGVAFHSVRLNFFTGTMDEPQFMDDMIELMIEVCNITLHEPEVQEIIKAGSRSRKYDILVVDQSFNEYLLALGSLMEIPTVYISAFFLWPSVAWSLNIPSPYSYVPMGFHLVQEPMNFFQRTMNAITSMLYINMFRHNFFPKYEALIKEHIPNSPPLLELEKNVSLVLLNTNPAIHPRRPTMPNVVEIGCVHCKLHNALPQELEDFMQQSTEGVVYFSLGSFTKGTLIPEEMKRKVLGAFARLPHNALWKYEGDIEGLPKNIKLIKWAPQQDILGHPKVRLFISHGGASSIAEAAFHGCPILGFPLSFDQLGNLGNARNLGYAEFLLWSTFTEDELLDTIHKMLDDPRYKETAVRLSKRLQDHPQPPAEKGAYWIEYVIRHRGAHHLKPAAQHLNVFQYFLLDVIGAALVILILVLGVALYILKKAIAVVLRVVSKEEKSWQAKKSN